MRYIASQVDKPIRIVGLATSLADAKDLGEWIGATSHALFNFPPGADPADAGQALTPPCILSGSLLLGTRAASPNCWGLLGQGSGSACLPSNHPGCEQPGGRQSAGRRASTATILGVSSLEAGRMPAEGPPQMLSAKRLPAGTTPFDTIVAGQLATNPSAPHSQLQARHSHRNTRNPASNIEYSIRSRNVTIPKTNVHAVQSAV